MYKYKWLVYNHVHVQLMAWWQTLCLVQRTREHLKGGGVWELSYLKRSVVGNLEISVACVASHFLGNKCAYGPFVCMGCLEAEGPL